MDADPEQGANLRRDVSIAQSYAQLHPESFTGLRIDGHTIRMAVTDELEQHRNAISRNLHDPETLILEQTAYSRRDLQAIRSQIVGAWRHDPRRPLMGDGVGYSSVKLGLKPRFESLAQDLDRQYGKALEITIGFKKFPPGATPTPMRHATPPQETLVAPHIELRIELTHDEVVSGEDARGQVWFSNKGEGIVNIDTGSIVAGGIRRPGSEQMSGWFSGMLAGVGRSFRLAPGERGAITLVVGTASCEASDVYLPSPGRYEVLAPVRARVSSSDDGNQDGEMLARGATLMLR